MRETPTDTTSNSCAYGYDGNGDGSYPKDSWNKTAYTLTIRRLRWRVVSVMFRRCFCGGVLESRIVVWNHLKTSVVVGNYLKT